ncbi:hypothetical protein BT93_E1868 [Corymbia citriodora subsp. variegata]|nr:hypothetical protein BT93_E1868 [Corymbia citriodora subsp. variegata]
MQSSFSRRIATEMEQGASPRAGEKTTNKTQTQSHTEEDQEANGMISAPQDSSQSDSDASNGERRKETQSPSSEIDNGGGHNSDEKLGWTSPSLSNRAEDETKNNSEVDHHKQEEEQQKEEGGGGGGGGGGEGGRERLQQHRIEVAGQVYIPEIWGQEELLKDWVDSSVFEASLVPAKIFSAKAALAEGGRKANSNGLRLDDSC